MMEELRDDAPPDDSPDPNPDDLDNQETAHEAGSLERGRAGLPSDDEPTRVGAAPASRVTPTEHSGDEIGPYKLLWLLGAGGFGRVWEAEQEQPVRRRVALKIVKLGLETERVVARFEAERQALALMNHPGIAKVFDAGSTLAGRPYFVMELVAGEPITSYCDRRRLDTRQRLELFATVCRAVHHAHQKGIIHRDIKALRAVDDGECSELERLLREAPELATAACG